MPLQTATTQSKPVAAYPFQVERINEVAGASITGVDLSQPISEDMAAAIMRAMDEFHVIAFRDQDLTKDHQHAFTLNFGMLETHVGRLADGTPYPIVHTVTNVDQKTGKPTETPHTHGNYFWHTDKSYHEVPSLLTMLHAREVPPTGGDTMFANMVQAYEALSDDEKASLDGLRCVHSWEASRRNTGNTPATEEQKRERPPVNHPLVRTHPDGRKSLYLGMHVDYIEGMDPDESRTLLNDLLARATDDRFVYRHQWTKGDLTLWDNRVLLHRADRNFDMSVHPRILHRTVVIGTKPV
jgi:taurine dioxygenase